MRGSVAATLSGKVTVLERDVISLLANEVRMNMAGLTATEGKQIEQMQFGFWIVDVSTSLTRSLSRRCNLSSAWNASSWTASFMLQGKPNEKYFTRICDTIGQAMSQPTEQDQ